MNRRDVLRVAAMALVVSIGLAGMASARDRPGFLIGTGAPGGVYYPLGSAICTYVNLGADRHGLHCAAAISAGSIANIHALRSREIDAAIVQTDVLADAVRGTGPFAAARPWAALRVVMVAHDEPFTVVVRPDAGIENSSHLIGKRVNIGIPGSGHRLKMERVLAASGTMREEFAQVLELDPQEQVRALCEGRVDAIVYSVGHPNGLVHEAVSACRGRIVPLAGDRIRAMLRNYGEYREMIVPGGLYPGHPDDVATFGTTAVVVVTAEAKESAVYELTKAVFDEFDEFVRLHPAFARLQATDAAGARTRTVASWLGAVLPRAWLEGLIGPSAQASGGGSAGPMAGRWLRRAACPILLAILVAAEGQAQPATSAPNQPPPQVRELLERLDDPVVREWLAQQRALVAAEAPTAAPIPEAAEKAPAALLAARIAAIREHLHSIAAALPTVPAELRRVGGILREDLRAYGVLGILLLAIGFVALGFGAEWLFWRASAGGRSRINELRLATISERLRAVMMRLAFGAGQVLAFAIGSIGAFLLYPWPPVLRQIVLGYLIAFLALRVALVLGRFLLAPSGDRAFPNGERFRILPMGEDAAWFWYRRIGVLVGWFAFGYVTVNLLEALGLPPGHRRLVAYALGLGLLAIGIEIAWRRPRAPVPAGAAPVGGRLNHNATAWLLSAYFLLLWLLWVMRALNLFWFAVVAVVLPLSIRASGRAVNHILRPPAASDAETGPPSVTAACLERGVRAVLIIGAALLLADKWSIDLGELTATDTMLTRLVRGLLSAIVILLVADFAWQVLKAMIDRKLIHAQDPGQPNTEEARRRARVRTLLPIVRNILAVVMISIAAMMALASLGVEIGPLIAGAGVIGVAIGFGAQTLVRDVISGMFYLLDDAFRVGEYIQSGSYKGTVESFSLRSVKLRHHRGPLYTVPFGALGAVQNMSRDWVIDKLTVGVTYDSDLDKAKKLIKQIGKELSEDPEFAPDVLEPLKMQGVAQFGEFAVQIQMKMMTRPGQQFTIRRRAYAMIKRAFDANGIKFALPTVQVAGDAETATAAVARQGLELVKPPPAAR